MQTRTLLHRAMTLAFRNLERLAVYDKWLLWKGNWKIHVGGKANVEICLASFLFERPDGDDPVASRLCGSVVPVCEGYSAYGSVIAE